MYRKIMSDDGLRDELRDALDVEFLSVMEKPEDEDGHLTYSIPGWTFARDGSGGEYILLEDGSVGYWGSEGQCGRLTDSLDDAIALIVRCPWWMDIVNGVRYSDPFGSDEALDARIGELQEEYGTHEQIARALGIAADADVRELVKRFRKCADREPRLVTTYREDDGSTHDSSGSLFEVE